MGNLELIARAKNSFYFLENVLKNHLSSVLLKLVWITTFLKESF